MSLTRARQSFCQCDQIHIMISSYPTVSRSINCVVNRSEPQHSRQGSNSSGDRLNKSERRAHHPAPPPAYRAPPQQHVRYVTRYVTDRQTDWHPSFVPLSVSQEETAPSYQPFYFLLLSYYLCILRGVVCLYKRALVFPLELRNPYCEFLLGKPTYYLHNRFLVFLWAPYALVCIRK